MLTSMKLGLATTVAALSIAAVTSAGAAVNPISDGSAGAGSAPVRPTFEMQAQAPRREYRRSRSRYDAAAGTVTTSPPSRFKCYEDLGYGRTGLFGCGG